MMINYYEEFNLDSSKSVSEINMELTKHEGVWKRRELTSPEKARKKLSMIAEAREVFSSESARSKYDRDLENSRNQSKPASAAEQRENSLKRWVDQARMFFNDGSSDLAKAAIDKALGYLDNDSEDTAVFSLAADIYRECKEFDRAMNYINKAIILVPTDAYLYLIKAVIFFEEVNSYGKNYNACVEEGRKTLNIALSKAETANDNNMKATVIGAMAFSYYNLHPIDKKKAAELAWESKNIGVDRWGNTQRILDETESERKAVEQAENARREAAEKAEKAKRESEERERKARAAKAAQERQEAEERRQKAEEKRQYTLLAEDVKLRENKYVLAWVLFIGVWVVTIFGFYDLSVLVLFFFLLTLAFFNYTDVAYNGGSKKTVIMSIIGCLELTIQFVVIAGIKSLIWLPLPIGCIILSRIISAKRNPDSKESYLKFKVYDPKEYQTYKNNEWLCPSCGCKNASGALYCRSCGKYK